MPDAQVRPPTLVGKRYALVPLTPDFHRAAYRLSMANHVGFRWRFHGAIPTFEVFERALYANVLLQFVVVPKDQAQRMAGLVVAYDANLQDGYVYLAVVNDPSLGAGVLEGTILMISYLFALWPFRKIYLSSPEYNIPQFRSAIQIGILKEEGRLRAHRYYDGNYWDEVLLAIYRDDAQKYDEEHPGLLFRSQETHGLLEVDLPAD